METIRAKLAKLVQDGKQAQVKELLKKHGGEKLSDIPKENYPGLSAEAEAIYVAEHVLLPAFGSA
jgi:hypothetical protein